MVGQVRDMVLAHRSLYSKLTSNDNLMVLLSARMCVVLLFSEEDIPATGSEYLRRTNSIQPSHNQCITPVCIRPNSSCAAIWAIILQQVGPCNASEKLPGVPMQANPVC